MGGKLFDEKFIEDLLSQAKNNERLRINYDLRTSKDDGSQRMLNALWPGTVVAVHRHPKSNENVIVLHGCLYELLYDECGNEVSRVRLCPAEGSYGYVVPAGVWHTVEVVEPTVIYEAKDGKYGEDGSEMMP